MNLRRFVPHPAFLVGLIVAATVAGYARRSPAPVDESRRLQSADAQALIALLDEDAGARSFGRHDAPIHLRELLDFECTACAAVHAELSPIIERALANGTLRYTVYDHPLPIHENAIAAAAVIRCAHSVRPSSAAESQRVVLEQQATWRPVAEPVDSLILILQRAGFDMAALQKCHDQSFATVNDYLRERQTVLLTAGASYAPLFLMNGEHILPQEISTRLRRLSASAR